MTEATTQSLINMYPFCIHIQASNKSLPKPPSKLLNKGTAGTYTTSPRLMQKRY
jgi:hypothetical protein